MGYHDTTFDAAFGTPASAAARSHRRAYGQAAFATAVDDGMMPDEVRQILAGRPIVDAFPVRRGETLPAYAERTVAEMMVAYLRDDLPVPGRLRRDAPGRAAAAG